MVTSIIDWYVVVDQMRQVQKSNPELYAHRAHQIQNHMFHALKLNTVMKHLPSQPQRKKRKLPPWMDPVTTLRSPTLAVRRTAPDSMLEYSCAVLNDGLFFSELRDGIYEGDGERLERCWKVMLLYFT